MLTGQRKFTLDDAELDVLPVPHSSELSPADCGADTYTAVSHRCLISDLTSPGVVMIFANSICFTALPSAVDWWNSNPARRFVCLLWSPHSHRLLTGGCPDDPADALERTPARLAPRGWLC